jgi:hypothetical protein
VVVVVVVVVVMMAITIRRSGTDTRCWPYAGVDDPLNARLILYCTFTLDMLWMNSPWRARGRASASTQSRSAGQKTVARLADWLDLLGGARSGFGDRVGPWKNPSLAVPKAPLLPHAFFGWWSHRPDGAYPGRTPVGKHTAHTITHPILSFGLPLPPSLLCVLLC